MPVRRLAQNSSTSFAALGGGAVVAAAAADVGATREAARRNRWAVLAFLTWLLVGFAWYRVLTISSGSPLSLPSLPELDPLVWIELLFISGIGIMLVLMVWLPGRSPHVTYRPEQIDVRLSDVVGIEPVKEEVIRSLNLFLAHKTFSREMGGTPRRGLLFEGAPGTGKTHLAKAMAREAGVPFLFISATSFQSHFYGATARKIRSYFKALRRIALKEGGAIGFMEEIDAIAMTRNGLGMSPAPGLVSRVSTFDVPDVLPAAYAAPATQVTPMRSEGVGGVVNELLVQMQSFDALTGGQKVLAKMADGINLLLPAHRQIKKPKPPSANILLIAATNRADFLDPALLRPGRFDRRLTFELPAKAGRRALVDHFLARKAHVPELDLEERRDQLAAATGGYTPVMIEHLLDEALINAVRGGRKAMHWSDLETARLTEEVGLKQPVAYTDRERKLIATHEAGHATVAYLSPLERRLEVLSIIKRRNALGLLAHGDSAEEYTRSRTDMLAFIQIAMAGMCAEELWFGDVSTGPGGDLLYATNVAAEMVGAVGMAGSLISYAAIENSAINEQNIVGRVLGDADGRQRVEKLLNEQKARAKELLEGNRDIVEALRDALLEREELIGPEITEVIQQAEANRAPRRTTKRQPRRSVIDLRDEVVTPQPTG